MSDPRDLLVRNEQAKLTATYLNGVAIATFAVGGLAPLVALVSGSMQPASTPSALVLTGGCTAASFALHMFARSRLRELRT